MNIGIFLSLFISFVAFFFCLFALSRDDFVFIRKNITAEEMFTVSFLLIPFILLFSRIFYVAFHYNPKFLHPLIFAAVPNYPGLSLVGGILGGVISVIGVCMAKKIAVIGRVVDIISLCLFAAIVFGIRPYTTILSFSHLIPFVTELFGSIFFVAIFILLTRFFLKEKFKDGSISLLFLLSFSFLSLLLQALEHIRSLASILLGEGSVFLIVLIISGVLFLRREKIQFKFKFKSVFKKR